MAILDDLQFNVLGLSAALDFTVGARLVYSDSTYECYDNYHVDGDVALQFGVTANTVTNEYIFTVSCNYGHRASTNATPVRKNISANLSWEPSGDGPGSPGSTVGMDIDRDPGSADWTVTSGVTIPPMILHWDRDTGEQLELFEGYLVAFVENDLWQRYPQQSGETARFAFRFDPGREDTSYFRMMRGMSYSGAWLNNDANGTYVRPDIDKWHLDDGGPWYKHGSGFWMQKNQPTSTSRWRYLAPRTHADAGYLPFCSAYVHSGIEVHTNPAWQFAIKKFVGTYLGHFPPPFENWPSEFFNRYHSVANRGRGRVIGLGVWLWRALVTVEKYRTSDPEVATLRLALQQRVLDIFAQIYSYAKPYKLLPNDPDPIWGRWTRDGSHADMPHPERNHGGPPELRDESLWMGGEFWKGLFHFWEGLKELGLGQTAQFAQCRQLMDFVAIGYSGAPNVVDKAGLFGMIVKWKNSHPYDPPSPLPPSWATAPSWPAAKKYTISKFGWAFEYGHVFWNDTPPDVNADLQYLSYPSSAVTGNRIAVFDFIKAEGMLSSAPDIAKINEIVSDYASKSYHYHYAEPLKIVISESANATESTKTFLSTAITEVVVRLDETANHADGVVGTLSEDTLILYINESADHSEGIVVTGEAFIVVNEAADSVESLAFDGITNPLTIRIDEERQLGEDPPGSDEVVLSKALVGASLPPLLGLGVQTNLPLLGGIPMQKNQNFEITRGDSKNQPVVVILDGGRLLDGSESWRAQGRDGKAGSSALWDLTSANGGIDIDPVTFYPSLVFLASTLTEANFPPSDTPKHVVWDLEVTKDGNVDTVSEGTCTVNSDVTR